MKKVILNEKEVEVVNIDKVKNAKYYGIIDLEDCKGFVIKSSWVGGNYSIQVAEDLTKGNQWTELETKTRDLSTILKNAIKVGYTVYEFDTYKQLFKWLSE